MLLTEKNYYSRKADLAYMSNSQYKKFKACPAAALAELRGEYTPQYTDSTQKAFLIGSYIDAALTGDLELFRAQHPEMYSTRGKTAGQLKAEFLHADYMIERVRREPLFMLLLSGDHQRTMTGEIAGVPFKGKADCILDESAVEQIRREFPENADLFEFSDGAIVDLKTARSFENVWNDEAGKRVDWIRNMGYAAQGAIYQALQGDGLPFILTAVTKEPEPDMMIQHIPDSVLSNALHEVEENAPRFQRIKLGLESPERCEKCAYCRMTRRLTRIEEYDDDNGEI